MERRSELPAPYWRLGAEAKEEEGSSRGRLFMPPAIAAAAAAWIGRRRRVSIRFDSFRLGSARPPLGRLCVCVCLEEVGLNGVRCGRVVAWRGVAVFLLSSGSVDWGEVLEDDCGYV